MKKIVFAVTALLLVLAVTTWAAAQPGSRDGAEQARAKKRQSGSGKRAAIKGRLSGKVNTTRTGETSIFDTTVSATGNLSALGRVVANCAVPNVKFDPTNLRLSLGVLKGTGTIKTERGETIFGKFTLHTGSVSFTTKGEVSAKVDLKITGGTGKYKGATGQAVGSGRANVFAKSFVIDLDGDVELREQSRKKDKDTDARSGGNRSARGREGQ
jgi:hypothetical protein